MLFQIRCLARIFTRTFRRVLSHKVLAVSRKNKCPNRGDGEEMFAALAHKPTHTHTRTQAAHYTCVRCDKIAQTCVARPGERHLSTELADTRIRVCMMVSAVLDVGGFRCVFVVGVCEL